MKPLRALTPALAAGLLAGCFGSGGPKCGELTESQALTNLVFEIDRELIPPGSADDDPRDTPRSARRKFRLAIEREIVSQCRARSGDFRPRESVLREFQSS